MREGIEVAFWGRTVSTTSRVEQDGTPAPRGSVCVCVFFSDKKSSTGSLINFSPPSTKTPSPPPSLPLSPLYAVR